MTGVSPIVFTMHKKSTFKKSDLNGLRMGDAGLLWFFLENEQCFII